MATNDNMEMDLLPSSQTGVTGSNDDPVETASNDGFDNRMETVPDDPYYRNLSKLLIQWIATITLTSLVVGIVTVHSAKGVLTPSEKDTYNILSTILILGLGLSFFVNMRSAWGPSHCW